MAYAPPSSLAKSPAAASEIALPSLANESLEKAHFAIEL
jgi:hypothetical protein